MVKNLKELYQNINELEIDGFNAPIKLYCNDEQFFIKDVVLKNNEIDGTFCNIELNSRRSSLKDELSSLIEFVEKNFDEKDLKVLNNELENKATEGVNLIKKILKK